MTVSFELGSPKSGLLLAFYGDDFTGSTDALESLVLGGIPTMLFTRPPTRQELAHRYPHLKAVGIAGDARSMTPVEMQEALPPIFGLLAELSPKAFHYKVCSTFDSSTNVGNLGVAAELAARAFDQDTIYALGGAPRLGRFLAFGHLFARYGADGKVYRIDRHPVMSKHPSTPMTESDLGTHIAGQNPRLQVTALNFEEFEEIVGQAIGQSVEKLLPEGDGRTQLLLFDAVSQRHVENFGQLVEAVTEESGTAVLLGPSSVGAALAHQWGQDGWRAGVTERAGAAEPGPVPQQVSAVDRLLVLSGSCSPMTQVQVEHAVKHGFVRIDAEPARLLSDPSAARELLDRVIPPLKGGSSVVVVTCGSERERAGQEGLPPQVVGGVFAEMIKGVLDESPVNRLVLAGGDTSSQTIKSLGIDALEMAAAASPGAPLCRIHASGPPLDGLQIALKGGQLGGVDYFVKLRDGD